MTKTCNDILSNNPQRTNQIALKTFFNIMELWQVKSADQIILLGKPSKSRYYNWKKGKVASLPFDTLQRISYIIGIYKSIKILLQHNAQANEWPHKPNNAFNGKSALAYMLNGLFANLIEIRRYLDSQLA